MAVQQKSCIFATTIINLTTMNRIYIFLLLVLSSNCVCAQKRLTKLVYKDTGAERLVDFSYDNEGRLSQATFSSEGKSSVATYTYEGTDVLKISHKYNSGTDTYTYRIVDGKITSSEIFLDVDFVNITSTYEYSGNKLTSINTSQTVKNKTKNMKEEYTWAGSSLSETKYYYKGELETVSSFVNTQISSHPILGALFGLGDGYPKYPSDDMLPLFGIYPFLGTTPEKLWGQVNMQDYYENKTYTYNYDYSLNNEGDVVLVKVTRHNSSSYEKTYELQWEGSSSTPVDDKKEINDYRNGGQDYGNGGEIGDGTDLNGNVIGNIYYNIPNGNGGYNPIDGCIEITKPTANDDTEGKDIFGEDFKNHFTGIIFKVSAGSGTIKLKAETTGNMMLKIRVGNNEPFEIMLNSKMTMNYPYNVSQPTYIYIYGSVMGSSDRTRATTSNALKIYSIEWDSTESGIEAVETINQQGDVFYNLKGQRVLNPKSGNIYIMNKKKILAK